MNDHINSDDTSDDVEQMLLRLTPVGAGPQVRRQVLGGVNRELADRRAARLDHRCLLAVAASVGLAAMLNLWVAKADNARQARIYGPPARADSDCRSGPSRGVGYRCPHGPLVSGATSGSTPLAPDGYPGKRL